MEVGVAVGILTAVAHTIQSRRLRIFTCRYTCGATMVRQEGETRRRIVEVAYEQFYFSLERQLGGSMVLEAAYNGVMGEHLQAELLDYNQINPSYLTKYRSEEHTSE